MNDSTEKTNLFAHPVTFVLTHIVFPLFAVGAVGYVYWITFEALQKAEGALATKMLVTFLAVVAIPVASLICLLARPKRISVWTQLVLLFFIVAVAYFAYPVVCRATRTVDEWIIGPTVIISFFIGLVPPVFACIARIATADWKMRLGADVLTTLLLTFGGPFLIFILFNILESFRRYYFSHKPSESFDFIWSVLGHITAVVVVLGTLALFIGFCRAMHLVRQKFTGKNEGVRRVVMTMIFGLALPWGGLALNLTVPFPADFANPWPWVLSALTTAVMLPRVVPARRGLLLWFFKFAMAPFVLYFFILFIPFLPLAILAILMMGFGFLILAPTFLFRHFTADVHESWKILRARYSKAKLLLVAALGFLLLPIGFVADVEIERAGLKTLLKWHTEEDFDAPPAPLPMSQSQAERIVRNANDFAEGAEIPFLSAWRTFRVYDGMYMADSLREELNKRILGEKLSEEENLWRRRRNGFGADIFGFSSGRRNNRLRLMRPWVRRPARTTNFAATCESKGAGEYLLKVHATKEISKDGWGDHEFISSFRLPAGTWIEGMRLKMDDGTWKDARASERKAAEFVYRHITEQRRDPSIVTLDTPTSGTLKIFPVGEKGRDVEITLRTTALAPLLEPIVIGEQMVRPIEIEAWSGCEPNMVTALDAAITLVSATWMDAHTNELIAVTLDGEEKAFPATAPNFKGDLRRFVRHWARTMPTERPGVLPLIVPPAASPAFLTTLRRELPGLVAFGDRPLDGWYMLETEDGGKVAVPYRKGEGALVFAKVKGATVDDGKWSEGAKLWARENEAFLKPALDLRKELLDGTRRTGVLTTQSAYLAVETSAQEKALKQKEMEALYGDKAFDFEEPENPTSSDAPGLIVLLICFLSVFAGCKTLDRRVIVNPGENQVLRVESGNRLYFELEENGTTGYQWVADSDDEDVEVSVEHCAADVSKGFCGAPGRAKFSIRVHRGFSGSATIRVKYQRSWEKEPIRSFTLSLFNARQ